LIDRIVKTLWWLEDVNDGTDESVERGTAENMEDFVNEFDRLLTDDAIE